MACRDVYFRVLELGGLRGSMLLLWNRQLKKYKRHLLQALLLHGLSVEVGRLLFSCLQRLR